MFRQVSETQELKDRIEARKERIKARLREYRADTRSRSRGMIEKLEAELLNLKEHTDETIDGMTEAAAKKLNALLADSDEDEGDDA